MKMEAKTYRLRKALSALAALCLAAGLLLAPPAGAVQQAKAADPPQGTVVAWGAGGPLPTQVRAVAVGDMHRLALKNDQTVVAWGDDAYGQSTVPDGLSGVTAIAAGGVHSLALKSDQTVVAWGDDEYGQATVPDGLSGVIAIAAGNDFSMALQSDGTVVAWGDDENGQATVPDGLSGVTAIAAGSYFGLALKSDGKVVAWGDNEYGQLQIPSGLSKVTAISAGEQHALALKSDKKVVAWGSNEMGQRKVPSGLSGVTAIAAGDYHNLALKSNGKVVAWGFNNAGQRKVPSGLAKVTAIAAGGLASLALKSDGTLTAWGEDSYSQTVLPSGLSQVSAISAGSHHGLVLKSDGSPVSWGDNEFGQAKVPAGLSRLTAVSAGYFHSLALKSDRTVAAWGVHDDGDGKIKVPSGLSDVTEIAAGGVHSMALKGDGTVVAWGDDYFGQTEVPADLDDVIAISAGDMHSLALKGDGTVVAWGCNLDGQSNVPPGLSNVIAIAAGGVHNLALKDDGTVVAWGEDGNGQSDVPPGLSNVIAIAGGGSHSMALLDDGTVVAWGDDSYGQTSIPAGLSDVTAIAAGEDFSLALVGGVPLDIPDLVFTKIGTPTISGTAKVGSVLKVSSKGSWKPAPTSFEYQWLRDGVEIAGAVTATYTLTPDDFNSAIQVKAKAAKAEYSDTWSKVSKATKKVALGSLKTKVPVVANPAGKDVSKTAPVFGQTLTVSTPAWSPAGTTLAYQWFRGKTKVGEGPSYTVLAADIGKKLVVKATGSHAGYKAAVKASKTSKKVAAAKLNAPVPAITGDPALGAELSVDTSAWGPAGVSFKYQWLRDGKKINGAKGSTYTTSATKDKGKSISVKVTGSLSGHTTVTKTSAKVKVGVLAAATPKLVNLSGKDPVKYAAKVGDLLGVSKGTWGPGTVTTTVEWYRSGTEAAIGSGDSYRLTSADVGKTIKVRVTGEKDGFTTVHKDSKTSLKIKKK
jgi:alpha-tubulin suppressor-like RCC1 family protein